ncbi:MAG: hypothetical protein IPM14_06820 [bacterium]|nr:hypothetical protein [bacterium]
MAKDTILIFVNSPILNPREIIPYPNLSTNYSVYLNTLLFSNWFDILSETQNKFDISIFMNELDKEYLPRYILPNEANPVFYKNELIGEEFQNTFISRSSNAESKTLVLFFNSIGLKMDEIFRLFSLIQIDEQTFAIGKSDTQKINCVCMKQSDVEIPGLFIKAERNYQTFLKLMSDKDYFVHTIKNFLSIDDFEDIKKLYIELSKKESLSYCSQKMHESFNDLFIEYKELLNV